MKLKEMGIRKKTPRLKLFSNQNGKVKMKLTMKRMYRSLENFNNWDTNITMSKLVDKEPVQSLTALCKWFKGWDSVYHKPSHKCLSECVTYEKPYSMTMRYLAKKCHIKFEFY